MGMWCERCGVWRGGVGVLSGKNLSLEKERFSPDPPLSKETYSNLYLFFSRFTAQTIFICFQLKVASTFSRQTPIQSLFILNFKLLPLFSSSTAQSYFICLNFKLLPLFSRFDTRLLSAFPLSAQLIYTGSENTWLVYMRMLKSMSCFCTAKKHRKIGAFLMKCGNVLLSHTVSRTVPSALCGLTSVFGMRTGGSHMI